jgi:hypothetical protein
METLEAIRQPLRDYAAEEVLRDTKPKQRGLPAGIYRRGKAGFLWLKFYRDGIPHRESVRGALLPDGTICTGLRLDEAKTQWRQVDFAAATVTLDPGTTKNDEGRTFPMTGDLRTLLTEQRATTEAVQKARALIVRHVFHWEDGRRIRSYWASWRKAVIAAGCPARIPHDLRRTAVRHFDRCGIPRPVAMLLTGHKSETVFTRYNVAAKSDLAVAAARLDAQSLTGTNPGTTGTPEPLATTPQAK